MHASKRRFRRIFAPVLFALFALQAVAQTGKLPPATRAKIDDAVSHFMAASSAPGVAVAVVEDGEFTFAAGYGMADLENQVPVTPETLFRLASVSKPITAVAALQLWEQGKLDLDSPVQKYCPAFPDKGAVITTRELLGHLGGIRHYREGKAGEAEVNSTTHFADPIAGGLSFFQNDPLVHAPGTHFSYSTQGYTLVGCAIAAAAAAPYTDYVRQHVFTPAGMASTQVDDRFALIQRRTRFYSKDASGKVVNSDFLDSSYKIPGGGWLSSAADMARFEVALLTGSLVKPSTFDLMTTPLKPSDGSKDTYGLGLGVRTLDGEKMVAHGGGQQGTSTYILILPARRSGIVVLVNMDEVGADDLAQELAKIVLAAK
jgi:CubicO group peptidase (beta-lactamase class C family)